jgi:hypothetical protein
MASEPSHLKLCDEEKETSGMHDDNSKARVSDGQALREGPNSRDISESVAGKGLRATRRKGRVVGTDKSALIAPPEVPRPKKPMRCRVIGGGRWGRTVTISWDKG